MTSDDIAQLRYRYPVSNIDQLLGMENDTLYATKVACEQIYHGKKPGGLMRSTHLGLHIEREYTIRAILKMRADYAAMAYEDRAAVEVDDDA